MRMCHLMFHGFIPIRAEFLHLQILLLTWTLGGVECSLRGDISSSYAWIGTGKMNGIGQLNKFGTQSRYPSGFLQLLPQHELITSGLVWPPSASMKAYFLSRIIRSVPLFNVADPMAPRRASTSKAGEEDEAAAKVQPPKRAKKAPAEPEPARECWNCL
eukprot:1138462-Pelagomonas_calceolata.AAC.4